MSETKHNPENERTMIEQRFRSVSDEYFGNAPVEAYVQAREELREEIKVKSSEPSHVLDSERQSGE